MAVDFERVARELIRALRGSRSQTALSRRLGYSTNVLARWEAGRRWPRASDLFRLADRVGVDLNDRVGAFFGKPRRWVASADLTSPTSVARVLRELEHPSSAAAIAQEIGVSRWTVTRWVSGEIDPAAPDLLRYIGAATGRLADFVAVFVPPGTVPSLAADHAQHEAMRAAAQIDPWALAVALVFDLADYQALSAHEPGWIARRLGIPREIEERVVAQLIATGALRWVGRRLRTAKGYSLNTRAMPDGGRAVREFYGQVALDRLRRREPGLFGYSVFAVAEKDLARLEQLWRDTATSMWRDLQTCENPERVVVSFLALARIDDPGR